jgi:hypothetical protein
MVIMEAAKGVFTLSLRPQTNDSQLQGGILMHASDPTLMRRVRAIVLVGVLLASVTLLPSASALAAAPPAPSGLVKLSGSLPADANVQGFRISPDSRYVAFLVDPGQTHPIVLESVSIHGGTPVTISLQSTEGGSVNPDQLQISPVGQRAVYLLQEAGTLANDLYSVPLAGTSAGNVRLSPLPPAGGSLTVSDVLLSPDGSQVVYDVGDPAAGGPNALYSVPVGGPGPGIRLTPAMVAGGQIYQVAISPDGRRVIYLADQETLNRPELFSVPMTGGGSTKLNPSLVTDGAVVDFQLASDGSRVAYIAFQDDAYVSELYSVPAAGGPAVKLNPPLSGSDAVVRALVAGTQVVYEVDGDTTRGLYRAPISGPAGSGVLAGCAASTADLIDFSPASATRFLYLSIGQSDMSDHLYSAPLSGSATCTELTNLAPGGAGMVMAYGATSEGQVIYYFYDTPLDPNVTPVDHIYSVPLAGPAAATTALDKGDLGSGSTYKVNPQGARVVYPALDAAGAYALFDVSSAGPAAERVQISGAMTPGGSVVPGQNGYDFSPDNRVVVYMADAEVQGKVELWAVGDAWWSTQLFLPRIGK